MSKKKHVPTNTTPTPSNNETKQQAEDRLSKVKEQAIIFEGESSAIKNIVSRASQRLHIQQQATSAMAWPLPDFITPNDDLDFYDTEPLMPPQSWTMMGTPQNEPPSQDTAEDYILQCTICASLAKQAMARASNTKQPLAC